jgi:hypothetical protein
MGFDVKAAIAQAKKSGPDMTKAQAGGGFELAPEGFARARFVGYFELGKVAGEWKGKPKMNDKVELVFELSGPKHAARDTDSGKVPFRVTKKANLSFNENSVFYKLFKDMNWEGKATHMAELLGESFVCKIKHNVVKGDGGKDFTYVNIEDIARPFGVNVETGDEYRINVDEPLTPLKLYLWNQATPEMWDSLFIEGMFEERKNDKGEVTAPARSKNVIQLRIMKATNWKASPVYEYAMGKVTKEDAAALDAAIGESEDAGGGDDPLEGVA